MKLAVISDLHLGDPTSSLCVRTGDQYAIGPKYQALANKIHHFGKLDYLVLLGDVFDFSITNFSDAYEAAKPFLRAIKSDAIANEIIYVPGNHDFTAWSLTMHESNIINQIKAGSTLKDRWSVPAVIDSRHNGKLMLSGVKARPDGTYGDLFFDQIGGIKFNVAYPNLYIVERTGRTTLITHGHYFESYWSLTSRIAVEIFKEDLKFATPSQGPSIEEFVAVNYPLNDLASSGLGMAGPLTPLVRSIEIDAKSGNLTHIRKYLKRLRDYLDKSIKFEGLTGKIEEFLTDQVLDAVIKKIIDAVKNSKSPTASPSRYNANFFADKEIRENILHFLDACVLERTDIFRRDGKEIPAPERVLFGHTHVPILSSTPSSPTLNHEKTHKTIEFWNTGGWLQDSSVVPAVIPSAVFFYDDSITTGSAWSSAIV